MTYILDYFDDLDGFENSLDIAQDNARYDAETDFIDNLRDKLEEYGERMFLSHEQYQWLVTIASRE